MEQFKKNDVLIIDDDVFMMQALSLVLEKYNIKLSFFSEPLQALQAMKEKKYDILIVNYIMPSIKSEDFIKMVRDFEKDIYVILMSAHREIAPSIDIMRSLDIQAFFEKGSNFDDLVLLIESGYKQIEQVSKIKKMSSTIENFGIELATLLKNTVGARDNYTKEHSERVSKYCDIFADYLCLTKEDKKTLVLAAEFHDIGKIGVSDLVLLKPGKLTDEEYSHIKLHPVIGENILSTSEIFKSTLPLVRHHHERYDGQGYPDKLKGEKIPYLARILSVVDTFDAITSNRVYREKRTIESTVLEIENVKGKQLDPVLADKFIDVLQSQAQQVQLIMNEK